MHNRRKSKQRERIYNIIKDTPSHPTAQWIYDMLRKEMSSVSMGNMYRNIKILIEEGRIKSRELGDGIDRYDAITDLHYHFICNKCKSISDFMMPIQIDVEKTAKKNTKNIITGHTIQLFGLCENCNKIKSKKE
jgi:Fur family transcriptional regulator, peroxide stress response regulator